MTLLETVLLRGFTTAPPGEGTGGVVGVLLPERLLQQQRSTNLFQLERRQRRNLCPTHGHKVDNVKAVTVVMLYKKDNVFKIQTHLCQALIVYVHNMQVDNV